MQRRAWLCQTLTGATVPACSITVYVSGTTTKATIYSDQAGSTSLANPISAGTDGTYTYYAPSGRYTEVVTAPGFTFGAAQTQDFILHDPFAAPGVSPNIFATSTWLNATPNCTNVTPATAGQTWCFDQTLRALKVYDGTKFATIATANTYIANVRDYGATGDGVTDDAPAVQRAFTAVAAAGGGRVDLPLGTYLLQSRVLVGNNTAVVGAGWGSILKVGASINTAQGQALYTATGVTTSNLLFADFQIDGNKANVPLNGSPNDGFQSALHLNQVDRVTVRNLYIHDSVESCLYIQNSPTRFVIDGNSLEACGKASAAAGHGVSVGVSPTYFRIVNNYVTGALRSGVSIVGEGGLHADQWVVANNVLRANLSDGILVGDSGIADGLIDHYIRNGAIVGNTVQGNGRYGIALSENATTITGHTGIIQDIAITGNAVQGNTSHGIALLTTNNGQINRVNVSGNTAQDNGTYGVNINAAAVADTFVTGNHLTGNGTAALTDSGTRTAIGANVTDLTTGGWQLRTQHLGPHALGGALDARYQSLLAGTYTPTTGTVSAGFEHQGGLAPLAGTSAYGAEIQPSLTRPGSGTMPEYGTLHLYAPGVGGPGTAITAMGTLIIETAPGNGGVNYGFWQKDGTANFNMASKGVVIGATAPTDQGAGTVNAAVGYYANSKQFINASGAIINQSVTFASGLLNTLTANGMMIYCSDCTAAGALDQTCVGGGTGNLAVRINGVAKCAY